MAERIRGREVSVKVSVDGRLRFGLFRHITTFTRNNKDEIVETPLLGQDVDALDYIHNGFDLSWTSQIEDAENLDFVDELITLQREGRPLPQITISVEYRFRDPAVQDRMVVYRGVKMKEDSEGFSNRTAYVECQYSAKATKRSVIALS
jgi:hypothetical protein